MTTASAALPLFVDSFQQVIMQRADYHCSVSWRGAASGTGRRVRPAMSIWDRWQAGTMRKFDALTSQKPSLQASVPFFPTLGR
jgi:hypothetical protein